MAQKLVAEVVDKDSVKVVVRISMTIGEWKKLRDSIEPNTNSSAQNFFLALRNIIELTDVEISKVVE